MSTPIISASAVAADLGATLHGPDIGIVSLAPIGDAGDAQLTFVLDPVGRASELTAALRAGAVVLVPEGVDLPDAGSTITVGNPRAAFAKAVARHFAPRVDPGVAETARIHPDADVHPSASIGEYTVVREGAVVGAGAEIRDHVVIGRGVHIGPSALIKSHAVIGEEGFGIEKDGDGNNLRIPHVGSVRLDANVEVGNFTTVCSGTIAPTTIGAYTKIDDHVHVAHNCRIGRNVIITACAEISGSVIIEDDVWIGPNASIIQGVTLGEHSLLGIGAVALKSIPADEVRVGNPARRLGDNPR